MESRRVDRDSKTFHQSVSATNDRYMVDALSKVRESDITHSEDLKGYPLTPINDDL